MRIFPQWSSKEGKPCPICGTHDEKPCTLVAIDGTADDGIEEATRVHVDCLCLRYWDSRIEKGDLIYQVIPTKKDKP